MKKLVTVNPRKKIKEMRMRFLTGNWIFASDCLMCLLLPVPQSVLPLP